MAFAVANDAVTKAFQNLGNDWALIAAGNENDFNAMTISWGSLGFIWQRPIITAMVRPQRHTYKFTEKFETFSISFFNESHRKAMTIMGTKSGRDQDKIKLAGLTPTFIDGVPAFKEAYLTAIARKLYRGKFEQAGFLDQKVIDEWYPEKDFHTVYYAELIKVAAR